MPWSCTRTQRMPDRYQNPDIGRTKKPQTKCLLSSTERSRSTFSTGHQWTLPALRRHYTACGNWSGHPAKVVRDDVIDVCFFQLPQHGHWTVPSHGHVSMCIVNLISTSKPAEMYSYFRLRKQGLTLREPVRPLRMSQIASRLRHPVMLQLELSYISLMQRGPSY